MCSVCTDVAVMLLLLAGLKLRQKALPLADRSQWWWTAPNQTQPTFYTKFTKVGQGLHDAVDSDSIDSKITRGLMC